MFLISIGYDWGYLKKWGYSKNIERMSSDWSILAIVIDERSRIKFALEESQLFDTACEYLLVSILSLSVN